MIPRQLYLCFRHIVASCCIAILLVACGGGEDASTPAIPAASITPAETIVPTASTPVPDTAEPVPVPPSLEPTPIITVPAAPALAVAFAIKQLNFSWTAIDGATYYKLYQNLDGVSGFAQVGVDTSATAANIEIAVHRHHWRAARYRVEACNTMGCTASAEVDTASGMLSAIGYGKASNSQGGDWFGTAVAVSADGNTLVVGAPSEASNATGINADGQGNDSVPGAGAVYVFTRHGGAWSQQAYIKASNTQAGDLFGYAVALSADGSTLAVGAPGEDSNAMMNEANNDADDAGAVYVYARSGNAWMQQAYVKASNAGVDDQFGEAVAMSADGNTLVAGAPQEDSNTMADEASNDANDAGAVYVYARSGNAWTQQAYVKASNAEAGDRFGAAVVVSGDGLTLAVGAHGENSAAQNNPADNSVGDAGAVYVYTRSNTVWTQQAYVKASNPGPDDRFGWGVAMSADGATLAVGARGESSNATGINPPGGEADNSAVSAGAAYVYIRSGDAWAQQAYVKASNAEVGDRFGSAVALSGNGLTLAVGASLEAGNATGIDGNQADNSASNAGATYVYARNGTVWSQRAYVKAVNTGAQDQFGYAVALSGDGASLVVGAWSEDSNAVGIHGNQHDNSAGNAGAVYVY